MKYLTQQEFDALHAEAEAGRKIKARLDKATSIIAALVNEQQPLGIERVNHQNALAFLNEEETEHLAQLETIAAAAGEATVGRAA